MCDSITFMQSFTGLDVEIYLWNTFNGIIMLLTYTVDEKLENMTDFVGVMAIQSVEQFQELKKDMQQFMSDNLTEVNIKQEYV